MTTVCAPGKIILLGEHAVVYGRPALAVPVRQVKACATVEPVDDGPPGGLFVDCPDLEFSAWLHEIPGDHPLAAICAATLVKLSPGTFSPIRLTITSTIPVAAGLGSSAAVSVAVARALNRHFGGALTDAEVSDLAFTVERIHHGTPSGIDNTSWPTTAPSSSTAANLLSRSRSVGPSISSSGIPASRPPPLKR
jgi:mevalonate kinase